MEGNYFGEEDSSSNSNENNTLYQSFKDVHPCWLFVGNALLKMLYVLPGIFFNFSLIAVTIRSKNLRGTTNYLLALNSMFELLHQPGHFLMIYTALSGLNFLDFPLAARLLTMPLFGLIGVGPSLFFTGLDRLLAITFARCYGSINKPCYLLTITAACCAYSGYGVALVLHNAQQSQWQKYQTNGNMGDFWQGEARQFYYVYQLALNGATIGIYLLLGCIILKHRGGGGTNSNNSGASDQLHRRLFRSLLAIISFGLGGYFLMRIFTTLVLPNVNWSQATIWTVRQAVSVPQNISAGSSAPILYWTSVEYRRAFQREIIDFRCWLQKYNLIRANRSHVHTITTANTNNNRPTTGWSAIHAIHVQPNQHSAASATNGTGEQWRNLLLINVSFHPIS